MPKLNQLISYALSSLLTANIGCADELPNPLVHEHYNPGKLNELAMLCVQHGDYATANTLLDRAVRLAPRDTRITLNLTALHTLMAHSRNGTPVLSTNPSLKKSPTVHLP